MTRHLSTFLLLCAMGMGTLITCQATPATVQTPGPTPSTTPGDGVDPAAIAVLDALERSTADLVAFTSTIHYEVYKDLLGEKVVRKGHLIYHVDPDTGGKSIAILFDTRIADGRKREKLRHYVFSDRWFVEVDHDQKLFIKREVAAPGETFDPLKLGEGPIPLPIGQKRDDVLARFDVSLTQLPTSGPLAKLQVQALDGLRLIPRADTPEARKFKQIDLFYDRTLQLPVGIDVLERNDDRKTVRLGELRRNPELSPAELQSLSVEVPEGNWNVDIRPLRK